MNELPVARPSSLTLIARDIKLSHSVFALPFAVLAAFMARREDQGVGAFAGLLAAVVLCMVLARTWAMLVNRLADARIDAGNPRTARRLFASGGMTTGRGWAWAAGAAAGFAASTALFGWSGNWWPLALSVPVLAWIALYSWTKRFTWACHAVLGSALAASPLAAAVAVDPGVVGLPVMGGAVGGVGGVNPAVWWLAGMVLCWVAGFDVIYALQDVEFDREHGLFSVPARLGVANAIRLSRVLHAAACGCLGMAWRSEGRFGAVFGAAVVLAGGLLVMEHVVLARRGKAGLDMAFFTINGVVSVVVGALGCLDLAV